MNNDSLTQLNDAGQTYALDDSTDASITAHLLTSIHVKDRLHVTTELLATEAVKEITS
jgi:hypothetical protein